MVRGATGREQDMSRMELPAGNDFKLHPMLVITPLGHVARLTPGSDGRYAFIDRPPELNDRTAGHFQMTYEKSWLEQEGFVELACGRLKLEPNPELEKLCIEI
jgi:hypothetical protein